jgi:hypothetical protein
VSLLITSESFRLRWELAARLRGLLRGGGLRRLSMKLVMELTYLPLLLDFICAYPVLSFY